MIKEKQYLTKEISVGFNCGYCGETITFRVNPTSLLEVFSQIQKHLLEHEAYHEECMQEMLGIDDDTDTEGPHTLAFMCRYCPNYRTVYQNIHSSELETAFFEFRRHLESHYEYQEAMKRR